MKKIIHIFIYMIFTFALLITSAYAWYTNYFGVSADEEKLASNASYYASGTGTQKDPFIITEARHLYNLAWLQDLGYYDADKDSDTSTPNVIDRFYFKLGDNIDMSELSRGGVQSPIPPIGIDAHPFISNFEGNGKTIDNLRIDTNFNNNNYIKPDVSVLNDHRTDTIDASNVIITNYVGLFGHVGPTTVTTALEEKVQNFYIDNAVITSTKNCLAGIIAGYASTNVSDIGVHYGRIAMNGTGITGLSSNVISYYTLIGDYNKSISWEDKPSSGSGGTGQGDSLAYGGNFDTDLFFQRMALIYANKTSSTPSPYFPEMESQYLPASGYKVPLTVVRSTITEANYTGATAKEVISSENIGYALGNQNKEREVTMEFGDPLIKPSDNNSNYVDVNGETPSESKKVPRQMFEIIGQNGNYQGGQIRTLTDEEFAALPQNIQDLIPDSNVEIKKTFLRLQQRYSGSINVVYGSQNDAWSPMGQISYYGQTYGEDGTLYNSGIVLPQNAIWFKPKNAGTVRIVMYSADNGKSFRITKVRRNSATTENPFAGSDLEDVTSDDSTIQNINNYGKNIPAYIIAYYEFEISQEEIDAGNIEYIITKGDENGAYFYYLDIGISGSAGGDAPTQDPVIVYGAIDDIDFVYRTGTAGTGDFIALGELYSNVFFQISGTTNGLAEFYFRRNNDDADGYTGTEGIVLYYPSENNSLSINWSKAGTKGKATKDDCETLSGSVLTGGLDSSESGTSTTLKTVTFAYTDVNGTLQTAGIAAVTSGYAITQPTLSIPGYKIDGYYSDVDCKNAYTFGKTAITADITIYVKVTATTTYTVTFDPDNGSATSTTKVAAGGLVTKPTDPVKSGYIFTGWVDSSGNAFDFTSDTILANTTLKATYKEAKTVTFVDQNGNTIKSVSVASGETINASDIPTTTDDYYVTSVKDSNGNDITSSTTITSDTTVIVTKVNKYEVTFDTADLDVEVSSLINNINGKVTLPNVSEGTATVSKWQVGDQTYNPGDEITLTADMTLTAVWDYADSVIFDAGEGTFGTSSTSTVTLTNGNITELPTATRENYAFVGWYLDSEYTQEINETNISSTKITVETIYAKWRSTQADVYEFTYTIGAESFTGEITVTLDENGNQVVTYPTFITYNGLTISNVTWCDSRTGYTGGVNDQYNQDQLTYGSLIDSNYNFESLPETLHPVADGIKVLKIEYYNPGNEWLQNKAYFNVPSVSGSSVVIDLDIPQTITSGDIVYQFYTLDTNYWGGGNDITDLTAGIVSGMSNVFVAAEYRLESFSVTFDTDGGSAINPIEVENGSTVTRPASNPTKTNAIFVGWYADESCETEFDFSTPITKDTTIYAKFISTVSSSYEHNFTTSGTDSEFYTISGSLSTSKGSVSYNGENLTQCLKIESKTTITFTIESDSTLTLVFNSNCASKSILINNVAQTIGSDGTLTLDLTEGTHTIKRDEDELYLYYMKVETAATKYTVSFETNGGTAVESQNITIGNQISEPTAPTKDGYLFAGWYEDSNLSTPYDFSKQVLQDITLYAKWTEIYIITFDVDGETTEVDTNASGNVTFPDDPVKDGYSFLGWYNGNTKVTSSDTFTSDTILTAKWAPIITFVFDDSELSIDLDDIQLATNESGIVEFPTASVSGYTITGWMDGSDNEVTSSTIFTEPTTVYAVWEEQQGYTVTFDVGSATAIAPQTVDAGGYATRPTQPTLDGYTFAGWFTDTTYTKVFKYSTEITTDTTIYAKWIDSSKKILSIYTYGDSVDFGNDFNSYSHQIHTNVTIALDMSSSNVPTLDEIMNYYGGSIDGFEFSKTRGYWGTYYDQGGNDHGSNAWYFGSPCYDGFTAIEILFIPTE